MNNPIPRRMILRLLGGSAALALVPTRALSDTDEDGFRQTLSLCSAAVIRSGMSIWARIRRRSRLVLLRSTWDRTSKAGRIL